jgi:hypothetical protein
MAIDLNPRNIAIFLRFKSSARLDLARNLPFLDGHEPKGLYGNNGYIRTDSPSRRAMETDCRINWPSSLP